MIARYEGRVVLVAGAIPGERVRARVVRTARGVIWADVTEVLAASPDRRVVEHDAACGGQMFRHIDLPRQRQLKSEIVADTFRRVGRLSLESATPVEPSPEHGYRLRARLHVREGRAGFFRAGTHDWCDAAATGQLLPETMPAVERFLAACPDLAAFSAEILLAENVRATERVLHLVGPESRGEARAVETVLPPGITGVTMAARSGSVTLAGSPAVSDTAAELFDDPPPVPLETRWTRHASAFFQGNRFLTGRLVQHVLANAPGDAVLDLYAGVGLFAVALLARGVRVTAVESDSAALADLWANTRPWAAAATVVPAPVEEALAGVQSVPDAIVVDPPRTGLSPEALAGIVAIGCARLVYVSCDPPTLARDTAKLIAAGYRLDGLRAFDLFPNTAHVEVVAVFKRVPA